MSKIERGIEIKGHKGYWISSYGRVFNEKTGNPLLGYIHRSKHGGYWRVQIEKKRYMIHNLVAQAFLKRPGSEFNIVDHWDGNTFNNNLYNLEYVTQSENMKRWHERRKMQIPNRGKS